MHAPPLLPTLHCSPFRAAVLALSGSLLLASCAGASDPTGDLLEDLSSPLTVSRPRTLLVHIDYQTEETLSRLSEELDLLEHADRKAGYVDALVDEKTYAALVDEGFTVVIDEEQTALLDKMAAMSTMSIPGYSCYRTVEETSASMAQLATAYPGLVRLVDGGDSYEKATAGGNPGYDLQVLVATNMALPGPKPRFFLMGAIHAREYTTAETVMRFAEELITGYGTDPDATWLLDNFELHVLPQSNPDGRKLAEQGYSQRKNRRPGGTCSEPPTSSSQIGIDLNRNSSYMWGGAGTSTSKCNLTYRGASALSEPETAAVQSYMASIFPDQRGPGATDPAPSTTTGVMITLHSYAGLVLYPWGYGSASAPNLTELATLGRKFGYHNRYAVCQAPICLYAASGTTDDWAYGELGIASYTFEIGSAFFQSCSTFTQTVLPDNLKALRTAFKHARRPYQTPKGPDALNVAVSATSVPAGAAVTLTAVVDDTRYNSNGWGTEPTQNIAAARYSIDQASWAGGVTTFSMSPSDGAFSSKSEGVTATVSTAGWAPGRHLILVEGQDANGNWGAPTGVFLDVL
jgi:murein tripeptide amidase MpaA